MKTILLVLIAVGLLGLNLLSAQGKPSANLREVDSRIESGTLSISDRTYNVISVNKLGQYVSNIGQFYSSWQELAPTAEWPLGSNHEQMYRMNVYVGVPGNVVQTRTFGQKEWDPMPGYHNPVVGFTAISTDPSTWPLDGNNQPYWPARDEMGNPMIRSHQDTYAVYRDYTNYLVNLNQDPSYRLNIEIHQSSYAWNTALDEDYIIFSFDVINDTTQAKDSLYFCIYADFDAGGFVSGNEYADDKLGFEPDRQFMYFYDSDNWSNQWNGIPFYLGLVFLETPLTDDGKTGITDWHYTDNWSEPRNILNDKEQYWYMSSDPRLRDDPNWPNLFWGDDINYCDPDLIPDEGAALVTFNSSGPYTMQPFDTLRFIVAMVAGQDYEQISRNVDRIWEVYQNGFQVKSVSQPLVTGSTGDNETVLTWDNSIDREYIDALTGTNTLKSYRIYRTEDPNRLTWTLYDSIARRYTPEDPYQGNAYVWKDTHVMSGFYYSYSVTAYDSSGDESGRATLAARINTTELRPGWGVRENAKEVRVVPNPYIISARWERERLGNISDGEPIREMAFINLPGECTIRIFSVDGDLVKTINHREGTGTAYWDVRSDFNQMVSTGVYFFHVESSRGNKTGKFAIIR